MVRAIDIHVHPPGALGEGALPSEEERPRQPGQFARQSSSAPELAEMYAELDMLAVLLPIDAETATGQKSLSNAAVADLVRQFPQQFVGFGSVDPAKGRVALAQLDEIAELGLLGVKFHPGMQAFVPNDRSVYPLWERCQELGLVTIFHTGTTAVGAGQPGGGGVKLASSRPIPFIDDVAADFPELRIVMAHPPFPWEREGLALLMHKSNVYMDLSGWAPQYFDPLVVQYAKTIAQDKILFGSDWPALMPQRWEAEFAAYEIEETVLAKIMAGNAAKLLGLEHLVG